MLILDTTTKTIKIRLASPATSVNPDWTSTWADDNSTSFAEGSNSGSLSGNSDVTVVAAPGSGDKRTIKDITVCNIDTAPVQIIVVYDDNGTQKTIYSPFLQINDTWSLKGTYDSDARLKVSPSTIVGTQVQTDWEEINNTLPEYIKNKPLINNSAEADANISAGMATYLKNTGHCDLAKADDLSTSYNFFGLAAADVLSSFACKVVNNSCLQLADWTAATGSSTLTTGSYYYIDTATAGMITTTAPTTDGQVVYRVGQAVSADTMKVEYEESILL